MDAPQDSQFVLRQAFGRAFALERRLEQLKHRYADRDDLPGLQLLLQALTLIASELVRLLISQARELEEAPDAEHEREVRSIAEAATNAMALYTQPQLELVRSAHGRAFDPLVAPFVRLARAMARREDTELIFQPTENATYAAAFWVNERLEDLAKQAAPELQVTLGRLPRLQILYYPANGEQETFQHAIVAHEIGHITLRQPWAGGERVGDHFYRAALRGMANDVGRLAFERAKADGVDEKRLVEAMMAETRQIVARTERWFTEMACDLLAVRVVGPAFFLALFEFVAPFGAWERSVESHPASAWRLRRLTREVDRFVPRTWARLPRTWTDESGEHVEPRVAASEVINRFRAMIPETEEVEPIERRLVETAVQELQQVLDSDADSILGDAAYRPATFRADLELIWHSLDLGIAPAERVRGRSTPRRLGARRVHGAWSDALDWRSILNGGWFYLLCQSRDATLPTYRKTAIEDDEARVAFNHHILGSIELSEIHRRAAELRGSLKVLEVGVENNARR